jgi:hypothetical protein
MSGVFISFADHDQPVALALAHLLESKVQECRVFLTAGAQQITPGDRWLDRIESELRAAKVVIVILSRGALARPWVNFEAGAAWLNRARIIPACVGELLGRDLPKPYGDFQAVHLGKDDEVYQLITSVSADLGNVIPPMPAFSADVEVTALRDALRAVEESMSQVARTYDAVLNHAQTVLVPNSRIGFDDATSDMLSASARLFLREAAKTRTVQIDRSELDQD